MQTKIQKLTEYKGLHLMNEKRRKLLTETKWSMAAQVILNLNRQTPR